MNGQPQDTTPLAALPPDERTRALERYKILQPYVEHGTLLTHVSHHHGMPLRTVQRWLAQYRHNGLAGLARRRRRDRGHQRGLRPELKQIIKGLAFGRTEQRGEKFHRVL
jgi:putative transposase